MRPNRIVWSIALLVGAFLFGNARGQERIAPQPVSGKIKWLYDYAEGQAAARQSGKPMFVVFRCER